MLLNKSQRLFTLIVLPAFLAIIFLINFIEEDANTARNQFIRLEFKQDSRALFLAYLKQSQKDVRELEARDYKAFIDAYDDLSGQDLEIAKHAFARYKTDFNELAVELQSKTGKQQELGFLLEALLKSSKHQSFIEPLYKVHSELQFKYHLYSKYHWYKDDTQAAIEYAVKEFILFSNQDSYEYVLELYNKTNDISGFINFITSDAAARFNSVKERHFFFKKRIFGRYIIAVVEPIYNLNNWGLLIISVVVTVVWFIYLMGLKFFRKPNYNFFISVFCAALFTSEITLILYDVFHLFFVDPGWIEYHSLAYNIFVIGFIEEGVKAIVPLIVFLLFKHKIQEPLDYIIVASLSGMAFAFGENIIYSLDYIGSIDDRALLCTFSHGFLTSTVFYPLILPNSNRKWLLVSGCFLIAVILHGVYDYLLGFSFPWFLLPTAIIISEIGFWMQYVHNAINISPHFDRDKIPANTFLYNRLLIGFSVIILLEYIYSVFSRGVVIANANWSSSWVSISVIFVVFVYRLGKTEFVNGEYKKLQFFNFNKLLNDEKYRGDMIEARMTSGILNGKLVQGEVLDGVRFSSQEKYLLVQLVQAIKVKEIQIEKVLIRPVKRGDNIYTPDVPTKIRAVKEESDLNKETLLLADFPILGIAVLNEVAFYSEK